MGNRLRVHDRGRLEVLTLTAAGQAELKNLLRRFHCPDAGKALRDFLYWGQTQFIGYEYRGQTKQYIIKKGSK